MIVVFDILSLSIVTTASLLFSTLDGISNVLGSIELVVGKLVVSGVDIISISSLYDHRSLRTPDISTNIQTT